MYQKQIIHVIIGFKHDVSEIDMFLFKSTIQISLKLVFIGPFNNKFDQIQLMVWCKTSDKPRL